MHIYFTIRAIYSQVELWKTLTQCHFWKWIRINIKTGKEELFIVQGALRPTVLGCWEYVFPEECLNEVLSVFQVHEKNHHDYRLALFRKVLGCKRIPHKNFVEAAKIPSIRMLENSMRCLHHGCVDSTAVHCIGIKKDPRIELGGYYQEAL